MKILNYSKNVHMQGILLIIATDLYMIILYLCLHGLHVGTTYAHMYACIHVCVCVSLHTYVFI